MREEKEPANQPIRLPGLKPGAGLPSPSPGKAGIYSGLILSGTFYPDLKIGVLRHERIKESDHPGLFSFREPVRYVWLLLTGMERISSSKEFKEVLS